MTATTQHDSRVLISYWRQLKHTMLPQPLDGQL
jgi:hypothetical protein